MVMSASLPSPTCCHRLCGPSVARSRRLLALRCRTLRRYIQYESRDDHAAAAPFQVTPEAAAESYRSFHKSPLTVSPTVVAADAQHIPLYVFQVQARTTFRASVGRSMSVPWRDPATGKVSTRQRTVWTTLPHAFEFKNQYNSSDGPTQVYAGFELFESQVASLLPIDPSHFVKSTFIRKAASFEMTQTFAAEKTQARVSEHEAEVARQVLQREYGALVRLHDFQVEVLFDAVKKLLMPVYIFPGAPSPTIVSGLTGRAAGVVIHDPGLTAALAAGTIGTVFIFALGFPVFGTLIATISYFGVRTAMRWLPVWRLARLEGARQSDRTKNASMSNVGHNGLGSRQGPYNPFNTGFFGDLFTGKRSNWDYFDPFRSAGDFSGPRRPADPFYGYGRTGHGSQQEQQQEQYKTRHAGDGQGTYDQYQRETASRGPRAARHHDPKGYYKVLGVMPGARKEEIQSAFRKLALSKHPDKFPPEQRASATKEFSRITEAYQVLRNDGRRRSYDTNGQ